MATRPEEIETGSTCPKRGVRKLKKPTIARALEKYG